MTDLNKRFTHTRKHFENMCEPLINEDYSLQAAAFTSPPKWHLAHTSWFFETFLLKPYYQAATNKPYNDYQKGFEILFNSYYNGIGEQYSRPQRGLLSRPSVDTVYQYRKAITEQTSELLACIDRLPPSEQLELTTRLALGINHEQQHQELFYTDLKYCFHHNPLYPAYIEGDVSASSNSTAPLQWHTFEGGLVDIGHTYDSFCFDNELPPHKHYLAPFSVADRLTTNREYLAFIEDNGYSRPELWLADGWVHINKQQWKHPLYWHYIDNEWFEYTLHGLKPLDLDNPVCHVSAFEADAFATWKKARLLTEFEWEYIANQTMLKTQSVDSHNPTMTGQFADSLPLHPNNSSALIDEHHQGIKQLFGTVWEWTSSGYLPYPGFTVAEGAIGEYNGKFMCNQTVLRGGSCVTPRDHIRSTYRNFFYAPDRWQFTGIRLAQSIS